MAVFTFRLPHFCGHASMGILKIKIIVKFQDRKNGLQEKVTSLFKQTGFCEHLAHIKHNFLFGPQDRTTCRASRSPLLNILSHD